MKRASRIVLLATSLFYSTTLLAQEIVNKGDIIIHITISGSGSLGNDFMDIYKQDAKAEIIYKKFNRVNFDDLRIDTAYTNMDRKTRETNTKKLGQIIDRHRIYDTTKVTVDLKTDTVYHKTLQLLHKPANRNLRQVKLVNESI